MRTSVRVVHEDLLHGTVVVHLCVLVLSHLTCRDREGRGGEGRVIIQLCNTYTVC